MGYLEPEMSRKLLRQGEFNINIFRLISEVVQLA